MSGQANRIAINLLLLAGMQLAGCSSEEEAADTNTPQPSSVLPAPTQNAVERVRKDVRVIVEDEVAALPDDTDVIQRLPPTQSAAERNGEQIARLPQKPDNFPRPLILGANEIVSGDITIKLSGIDAPDTSKRCTRADGEEWPCGNFAKAALQRFVRARTLSCEGDHIAKHAFVGRCKIGKIDVARWLVEQGWAAAANDELAAAEKMAKEAGKGIWQR